MSAHIEELPDRMPLTRSVEARPAARPASQQAQRRPPATSVSISELSRSLAAAMRKGHPDPSETTRTRESLQAAMERARHSSAADAVVDTIWNRLLTG